MEKKGYSRKGFFRKTIHCDANGNMVGEHHKNFRGGTEHYEKDNEKKE